MAKLTLFVGPTTSARDQALSSWYAADTMNRRLVRTGDDMRRAVREGHDAALAIGGSADPKREAAAVENVLEIALGFGFEPGEICRFPHEPVLLPSYTVVT